MGLNYGIVYLVVIPASMVAGLYCTKTKRVRWITVLAFFIFIAFFTCMSTTNANTRMEVWGYPVLMGVGLSMTLVTLVAAGQLSVTPDLIAVATGIIISVRSLGGTIGIAICKCEIFVQKPSTLLMQRGEDDAVFTSQTARIPSNIASTALASGLPSSSIESFVAFIMSKDDSGIVTIPGVTDKIIAAGREAMLDTYVQAFRYVWLSAIPFLAVAAIGMCTSGAGVDAYYLLRFDTAAMFLIDPRKDFNSHIDAPLEHTDTEGGY